MEADLRSRLISEPPKEILKFKRHEIDSKMGKPMPILEDWTCHGPQDILNPGIMMSGGDVKIS